MKKLLLVCFFIFTGCATKSHKGPVARKTTPAELETRKLAMETDAEMISRIDLKPGDKELPQSAIGEINRVIELAKQKGKIEEVEVLVWSDMEYPSKNKNLSKYQVDLAEERGKNLERYLDRKEPSANIKVYNMAEKPSAFAQMIKTKDAQLKAKISGMNEVTEPSTALLMFQVKE